MYTVKFYEKINGESAVWKFLKALRTKAALSKDAAYNISK